MVADLLSLYSIGGLRISNLQLHSRAPKLRGPKMNPGWASLSQSPRMRCPCSTVSKNILFGNDHWLQGISAFPHLFKHIRGRKLSVAEGLSNRRWISLIKVNSSKMVLHTSISVTDLRYVS
jgi:hypothetical protein